MAVYKIYPSQDTTLYSEFPDMNSGLDSIIEVSSYQKLGSFYISRYLIQFSQNEIEDIINNKISGSSFTTYLRNFSADVSGLSNSTNLYFYPVSGSWNMGTGHKGDSPEVTNGVSWTWKDELSLTEWETEGGDFYPTPVQSQSFFTYNPTDVKVNVNDTVLEWYSGSKDNDGFLVKLTSSVELNTSSSVQPILKYFSIDTNTIYPPQLEFRWDDYIFSTGSSTNTILTTPESFISVYNNVGVYYSGSIPRFRIAAVPKYPTRQFITSSYYTTNYYLPESQSLYAIKDSDTNEYVIDFDSNYTRIGADEISSYFDLYMNGLEPERYYTILIKTVVGGVTKIFDENIMFKVSKG
jgi:hypothetical protein